MLVSIHIPKTAGTSFGISLVERYGRSLWRDYDHRLFQEDCALDRKREAMERALGWRVEEFESTAGIHGHFLGIKYGLLAEQKPCEFVTWLRHPVSRMMSHYYYWLESFDPKYAGPVHRRCIRENWSFEQFCMYDDFRNFQAQFLWGLSLESFSFIGITEHFDEDFTRFSQEFLGGVLPPNRVNATKEKPEIETLDSGLRRAIEEYHSLDMRLYEAALARRRQDLARATEPRAVIRAEAATFTSLGAR